MGRPVCEDGVPGRRQCLQAAGPLPDLWLGDPVFMCSAGQRRGPQESQRCQGSSRALEGTPMMGHTLLSNWQKEDALTTITIPVPSPLDFALPSLVTSEQGHGHWAPRFGRLTWEHTSQEFSGAWPCGEATSAWS